MLAVSADDLIGGATDVREWLADLDAALAAWAAVEEPAGLPGRTSAILGLRRPAPRVLAMVSAAPAGQRFAEAV